MVEDIANIENQAIKEAAKIYESGGVPPLFNIEQESDNSSNNGN